MTGNLRACFCGYSHWDVENRDRHLVSLVSDGLTTSPVWVSGDAPDQVSLVSAHTDAVVATGVSSVLDLRGVSAKLSSWDHSIFAGAGVDYRRLPIEDSSLAFSDESTGFRSWLDEVVSLPPIPLLVHCHMGVNRSASVAALVLALRGATPYDAVASVLSARPSAMAVYAPRLFTAVFGTDAASAAWQALESLRGDDPRFERSRGF